MKLLSVKEAAVQLGKSRQWIWALIQMRRIPAKRIGNQYVIEERNLHDISSAKENVQPTNEQEDDESSCPMKIYFDLEKLRELWGI